MSKVTVFSGPVAVTVGTVEIVPAPAPVELEPGEVSSSAVKTAGSELNSSPASGKSLEFSHYKSVLAERLAKAGFTPVDDKAQYRALLSYGVQEVVPDGSGVNSGFWVSSGYGPWYGRSMGAVYVDSDKPRREYRRTVRMVLERNDAAGERLYESTAVSIGSCDVLTVVFAEMVEALLQNYPQPNGSVQKVTVNGKARC